VTACPTQQEPPPRRNRRAGDPIDRLLPPRLQAPAQEIAAEAPVRRLGRPNADDAAGLGVAEGGKAERTRCVEFAPRLHRIAAEVRPLEVATGDAILDREIRTAAADGEPRQEIARKL